MFKDKPWYLSKTIIMGIIVLVMGFYRIEVDENVMKTITENIDKITELAAVAIMIYGRFTATSTLTVAPKTEHIADFVPPSMPIPPSPATLPVGMDQIDDARG